MHESSARNDFEELYLEAFGKPVEYEPLSIRIILPDGSVTNVTLPALDATYADLYTTAIEAEGGTSEPARFEDQEEVMERVVSLEAMGFPSHSSLEAASAASDMPEAYEMLRVKSGLSEPEYDLEELHRTASSEIAETVLPKSYLLHFLTITLLSILVKTYFLHTYGE